MYQVAPSVLSADFCKMAEQLKILEKTGVKYLHIDVMDGHFVPNISVGIPVVENIRKHCSMILDVHLMIEKPERYVCGFAKAGADIINFHYEACDNPDSLVDVIISLGKTPGMTIKPNTPVDVLYPFLDKLGLALIMSVEPGFGGQKFIESALDKAKKLKAELNNKGINGLIIEMDGGINYDNIINVVESGVSLCVVGSALFETDNLCVNIKRYIERAKNV